MRETVAGSARAFKLRELSACSILNKPDAVHAIRQMRHINAMQVQGHVKAMCKGDVSYSCIPVVPLIKLLMLTLSGDV